MSTTTSNKFEINEVKSRSDDLLPAIQRLLDQLSRKTHTITAKKLKSIIDSKDTHLFIARELENSVICGMACIVFYHIPTGLKARIEDVAVDLQYRGYGLGRKLTEHTIQLARDLGAESVDLTSHASRQAANQLYQKLGFKPRETNVYNLSLLGN